MVGVLGVGLAMRQAKPALVDALLAVAGGHIGTGFGHRRHRAAGFRLVTAAGTGVRRHCQLGCQEDNEEEAGEPWPAMRFAHESGACFGDNISVFGATRQQHYCAARRTGGPFDEHSELPDAALSHVGLH
ncbi:hypothetical protein CNECB9_5460020 [Cupriavidus necator]|uniref:Uncharacterized protein n=1 Tax=Cupriavidus necator TaxID=106590 RepID=A0A1K0IQI2_CUPNE|nr:hypothetical protein CNECB9_5460020 [Cupriavidus necator]